MEPARIPPEVSISEAHENALSHLGDLGLTDQSQETARRIWYRFIRYATTGRAATSLAELDADLVAGFCFARNRCGDQPALSTVHHRRTNVRLLFRIWRSLGLTDSDPTHDLALPSRSDQSFRALSDHEIDLCRAASLTDPTATRAPAVWAVAESGAHSAEIPLLRRCDVDVDRGTLFAPGGAKTDSRTVPMTEWGRQQLSRRIKVVTDADALLIYDGAGTPASAQAYVGKVIASIFARAGIGGSALSPRSITAWVGRSVLAETGRIEDVALRLGIRSLDRAAALIDWDWKKAVAT